MADVAGWGVIVALNLQFLSMLKIDNGGLNHPNPADNLALRFGWRDRKRGDVEGQGKEAQEGHDNSLHHQGPLGLQVQEPLLGGNDKDEKDDKDGDDGLEANNDGNPDNAVHDNHIPDNHEDGNQDDGGDGQLEGPALRADQFMRNAHPNKQFPPRNGAHIDGGEPDEDDGHPYKQNYYEEDEDEQDRGEDDTNLKEDEEEEEYAAQRNDFHRRRQDEV